MSHRRSTFATALLAGPLALALVACGGNDTDADDDVDSTRALSTTQTPALPETPDQTPDETTGGTTGGTTGQASGGGSESLVAAAQTALAEVAGATLFSIDGEASGWEVTLVSADGAETEVDVSPDGSTVTRGPVADTDDDANDRVQDLAERKQLLADASLDHVAAIGAAGASAPGGTVSGADLDLERGVATWDVQFDEDTADELTVTIDAVTGEVLGTERDD